MPDSLKKEKIMNISKIPKLGCLIWILTLGSTVLATCAMLHPSRSPSWEVLIAFDHVDSVSRILGEDTRRPRCLYVHVSRYYVDAVFVDEEGRRKVRY